MMTIAGIEHAIHEAKRFIRAAEKVGRQGDRKLPLWGTPETAACRRASMDLTRALAEMRK